MPAPRREERRPKQRKKIPLLLLPLCHLHLHHLLHRQPLASLKFLKLGAGSEDKVLLLSFPHLLSSQAQLLQLLNGTTIFPFTLLTRVLIMCILHLFHSFL